MHGDPSGTAADAPLFLCTNVRGYIRSLAAKPLDFGRILSSALQTVETRDP
jgi:hypothetical protein